MQVDLIGEIIGDIVNAILKFAFGFIVNPLNAILNPILGGTAENPVIDLDD